MRKVIDIDVERCLNKVRSNLLGIVIALVAGMLVAVAAFMVLEEPKDEYTATATVYSLSSGSYQETIDGVAAIRAYSYIVESHRIAESVAQSLNDASLTAEDIYEMISTEPQVVRGTTYIYENQSTIVPVYATSDDPQIAEKVANAGADAFVKEVNRIAEYREFAHVLDYSAGAEKTYNATKTLAVYMAAGAVVMAMLYIMLLIAMVVLSPRIMTLRDASLYGQFEILGAIPVYPGKDK